MSGLIGIPTPRPQTAVTSHDATAPTAGDASAGSAAGETIFDVSEMDFGPQVIEASMSHPVIVDFWAPWCGPCKQLTPALEEAVGKAGGKVRLAKINIDENQQIAAQLRIQSIPTVYAFFQGQPVDGFQGAVPPSELQAFVDKLAGLAGDGGADEAESIDEAIEQAQMMLDQGAIAEAQQLLSAILQQVPENATAAALMARTFLAAGNADSAAGFLDSLPPEMAETGPIQAVRASIALSQTAAGLADVATLRAAVGPDRSPEALFDLARKLVATGAREEGADLLLETIAKDRDWNDAAARKHLLEMFDAYGNADPFTLAHRRKLSAILFS